MALLQVIAMALLAGQVTSQVPIPPKPPGFTFKNGKASAGVQLEAYVDLLCPDSRSAYQGLKEVTELYDPEDFRLRFILFPLPYHQHAFATAEAAFTITSALGEKSFVPWLETMYANQDLFWNKATKDMNPLEVTDKLRTIAMKTFPDLTQEQWEKGMTGYGGTDADEATRVAWKYTCTRGISGTPMYILNGVPYNEPDATWTFEQWKDALDPLLKANAEQAQEDQENQRDATLDDAAPMELYRGLPPGFPSRNVLRASSVSRLLEAAQQCKTPHHDHRPCEFLPGRVMCCSQQEACILREGCKALGLVQEN